jgi:hypothetical protein
MKTAVEFLIEKTFSDYGKSILRQEIKMALEMEKQQIIDAHATGYDSSGENPEDYYNIVYDKTNG